MKKSVRYFLGGILALLGFSSCTALREARDARAEREREALRQQQMERKDQLLREMLEADENDPAYQAQQEAIREAERQRRIREQIEADRERTRLLYAVPNVPYREIQKK